MSDAVVKRVESKGVKFALQEDACKAVIHLASDKALNGLFILSFAGFMISMYKLRQ